MAFKRGALRSENLRGFYILTITKQQRRKPLLFFFIFCTFAHLWWFLSLRSDSIGSECDAFKQVLSLRTFPPRMFPRRRNAARRHLRCGTSRLTAWILWKASAMPLSRRFLKDTSAGGGRDRLRLGVICPRWLSRLPARRHCRVPLHPTGSRDKTPCQSRGCFSTGQRSCLPP